jgi:hypothetical protein
MSRVVMLVDDDSSMRRLLSLTVERLLGPETE